MSYHQERQKMMSNFQQEQTAKFTEDKDNHFQRCHKCNRPLLTVRDHYGAGSHYWTLMCGDCLIRFTYDTYGFKLITFPKEGTGYLVARWGRKITGP